MYQVALRLSYAMVVACTNRVVAKQRPLSSILVGRLPHVLTAVRGTGQKDFAAQRLRQLSRAQETRLADPHRGSVIGYFPLLSKSAGELVVGEDDGDQEAAPGG